MLNGIFFYNGVLEFHTYCTYYTYQYFYLEPPNIMDALIRPMFASINIIFLIIIPMLTMKLLAEEKKSNTIELLYTSPISYRSVVLGKFFASLILYLVLLLFTFSYPLILMSWTNNAIELNVLFSGYIGLILIGASFIALGLVASALTENQIIAAVLSFGSLLILWLIAWSGNIIGGTLGEILKYFSLIEHFNDFAKGIIDTKSLFFYFSFIFFMLFLCTRIIESEKWR